ncbi:MAG: DUF4235 domain-containing protein [Bifidobacteriaceae bacterium]|jgi:transcriptional regulator of nitric oxide reductase|nr:DUF4235 domain-containing protein [Bifidobacteriaceae bacterium]
MQLSKRIASAAGAMAAGFVASHLVKAAWRAVSGRKAPDQADDLSIPTVQVAVFAALVAAVTAAAQVLASRRILAAPSGGTEPAAAKVCPQV